MGTDKLGRRMECFILIFLAFSQLASALLRQPSDKTSNKIDQLTNGICDGRGMQQSFGLPRSKPSRHEPKNNFPTPELIRSNGYPAEEHWVTTPDSYILALHRIPHGLNNKDMEGPRPAILVQHGLLCSSADWVISTPSKGLGYILADAGYDVWLGNYRGMNHEVEWKAWSHLDFLWGIDADRFVFSYMLENLQFCRENDCRNL